MAGRPGGGGGGSGLQVEAYLEHYKLLDLDPSSEGVLDEAVIKKAYRKKALELHPDKNRDNPNAEALFDAVKKASEALLDSALRAEFASKLAARAAASARFKEQDEARRKLREALEARERAAAASGGAAAKPKAVDKAEEPRTAASEMQREIARLRTEGRDRLREMEVARALERRAAAAASSSSDSILQATEASSASNGSAAAAQPDAAVSSSAGPSSAPGAFDISAAVRVKWSPADNDAHGTSETSEGDGAKKVISENQLTNFFARYGAILAIISKKDKSACVCFAERSSALAAIASPPAPFFRVAPVLNLEKGASHGSSNAGAPAAAAQLAAASAGVKRPRYDDSDGDEGASHAASLAKERRPAFASSAVAFASGSFPFGPGRPAASASGATTSASSGVPAASFKDKEADTLRKMMEAAAARKAAQKAPQQ